MCVGGHVGRDETAIKDDALVYLERCLHASRVIHVDNALKPYAVDGLSHHGAEPLILTGDSGYVRDVILRLDRNGGFRELLDCNLARTDDAAS